MIYALIPTATVLLVIVGMAFSFKMISKLSTLDQGYQADVKIGLFWSFISVLLLTNFIEICIQLALMMVSVTTVDQSISQVDDSSPLSLKTNRAITIVKFVCIIIMGIIGGCVGICCKKNLPPNPNPRKPCGQMDSDCDHFKAICNIFLLVFFASTSFITTAALLFVHPVLVLSTVAYISTSIFCMAAVLALPSSFGKMVVRFTQHQNQSEFKRNCAYLCNHSLYIILCIAGNLLMLLFLTIISNADNTYTTDIFQQASSFIPSAILGGIGYLAKKKLTAKSKEKLDIPQHDLRGTQQQKDATRLLEEGRARKDSDDEFCDASHQEMVKLLPSDVEETQM